MNLSDHNVAEFDQYSENYTKILDNNLTIFGEKSDYFNRYKMNCLKQCTRGGNQNGEILDFGCGIGELSALIALDFSDSQVTGFDISVGSIQKAASHFQHLRNLKFTDQLPYKKKYNLIIMSNVLHHITPVERPGIFLRLKGCLYPGGQIVIFEHNPLNPLTLLVVKRCPLDSDAKLIRSGWLINLTRSCGYQIEIKRYITLFPKWLAMFRPLEPSMGWLPLGAQYLLVLGAE